jgi:hypothetical protein
MMVRQRLTWIVLISAILAAAMPTIGEGQAPTRTEIGDFTLQRSVDFLTDEVTYHWARSGDLPPPPFSSERVNDQIRVPGYFYLSVRCESGQPRIQLGVRPESDVVVSGVRVGADMSEISLSPPREQRTTVQMRFDERPVLPPAEWRMERFTATIPSALAQAFVREARQASRVRIRFGPFNASQYGRSQEFTRDMEIPLRGFSKSLEKLGCG